MKTSKLNTVGLKLLLASIESSLDDLECNDNPSLYIKEQWIKFLEHDIKRHLNYFMSTIDEDVMYIKHRKHGEPMKKIKDLMDSEVYKYQDSLYEHQSLLDVINIDIEAVTEKIENQIK